MLETLEEQLTKHLTDIHSIEVQALQQLLVARRMARDREVAHAFREHIVETEEHERLVRGRLGAHAADPSRLEDAAARAGGTAAVACRIRDQEAAMAERLAAGFDRAVDASLCEVAPADLGRQLAGEERAAAAAIRARFDAAVEAALSAQGLSG